MIVSFLCTRSLYELVYFLEVYVSQPKEAAKIIDHEYWIVAQVVKEGRATINHHLDIYQTEFVLLFRTFLQVCLFISGLLGGAAGGGCRKILESRSR